MSSGAGTNTVSSQSQPPAAFQAALGQVGQQAQQTAQTPYQPYTGQIVAPMNAQQYAGIQNMDTAYQYGQPYQTAAGNEIAVSTAPLLPGAQPYLDQAGSLYGMAANNAASLSGYVQPGIGQADSLYGASAQQLTPTQFSAGQVNQYESPYTQQVVNATQAQFNNQNQQQQSSIAGNAISQGAFGGDREGVAQGIAAGQEQLAQAPVIAGLQNQGYAQALNEFNTQQQVGLGAQQATQQLQQGAGAGILAGGNQLLNAQQLATQDLQSTAQGTAGLGQTALGANEANAWLNSQAGFGYANLGNQAYNQILSTGQAGLTAGNQEQQQQQSELNVPYEQYIQQQGYPFQVESWLSGLEGQLSNAAGGTASTTSPGPSPISQIGGLGLTGLAGYGLLNNAGLLGGAASAGTGASALFSGLGAGGSAGFAGDAAGVIGGALPFFERGGTIPKHAGGGIIAFPSHRTRPGIGAGANDNMHPMGMPRKLAVGGGILRRADSGSIPDDDTDLPIPPIPPQQGGIGSQPAAAGGIGTTASAPSTHVPWETLLAAGLSIMGGSSPNASVNIGRGGMQGLQWGEQQRAIQERENLARTTQEQQAKYQTGDLGLRGQQLQQTGELTKAQMAQKAAFEQAQMAQQAKLEGANLAETRRYHDMESQQRQDALNLGKYTYQQVTQPDPNDPTKTISGVLKLAARGDEQPTFIPTNTDPNKTGQAGGTSGREAVYFNRVAAAGNEAATAAKNIAELPIGTSTGWFGGRGQGSGLLAAGKESLTNSLTSQSVQDYNTMIAGVSRNLSTIEAAGLAPSGSLTHSMDSIIMKEGDTPLTQMRKLAEMRQIVEKGLEPNLANPRIPQQQRDVVTGIIKQIQDAIPFTQHDVTMFQRQGQTGQTLADYASGNNLGGKPSSVATQPQGRAAGAAQAWKYTAVGQGGNGMIHSNDGAHWFTPDGKPFGEP